MNDLVDRLRGMFLTPPALEAANEIERLRAVNAELVRVLDLTNYFLTEAKITVPGGLASKLEDISAKARETTDA